MIDLIGPELDLFLACRERIEQAIQGQRDYLQQKAGEGKVSQGYLNQMNFLLGAMAQYMEATEKLLQQIGFASHILGNNHQETQRLKVRVGELEEENDRLRYYAKSLGGDLTILPYIRRSDYQYA